MFKIFIISVFMYIYLTVLLRLFGKKEFSQLNVFDFVVFLVISEITTMSLETQDLSVLDSVIATLTLIILDRIESFITMRSKKLRDFFEGRPCYIIYRGKIQYQNMKKLRYSIDDPSEQTGGIQFWGSSFVAGPQGELYYRASDNEEESLVVDVDLKHSEDVRRWWPFLRDRRIDHYGNITRRFID